LATGHVYLVLGALLGPFGLGFLDPRVLLDISPLTSFLLAWVGLIVGLRFDPRLLPRVGRLGLGLTFVEGLFPMLLLPLIFLATGLGHNSFGGDLSVAMAAALMASAAGTAANTATYILRGHQSSELSLVQIVASLDDWLMLPPIAFAFFMVAGPNALVPFIATLGGAATVGLVLWLLAPRLKIAGEELVVIVGAAGLAGGVATSLGQSAVISGAIAGLVLSCAKQSEGSRQLYLLATRVERPFFLLLMLILGATLPLTPLQTMNFSSPLWALLLALFFARLLGKSLAGFWIAHLSKGQIGHRRSAIALLPMSPLALVLVADFHLRLASDASGLLLLAVALAFLVFELLSSVLAPYILKLARAR